MTKSNKKITQCGSTTRTRRQKTTSKRSIDQSKGLQKLSLRSEFCTILLSIRAYIKIRFWFKFMGNFDDLCKLGQESASMDGKTLNKYYIIIKLFQISPLTTGCEKLKNSHEFQNSLFCYKIWNIQIAKTKCINVSHSIAHIAQ